MLNSERLAMITILIFLLRFSIVFGCGRYYPPSYSNTRLGAEEKDCGQCLTCNKGFAHIFKDNAKESILEKVKSDKLARFFISIDTDVPSCVHCITYDYFQFVHSVRNSMLHSNLQIAPINQLCISI